MISSSRQRYDLLLLLSSAACGILQQTGGTICYGQEVLHLVVSYSLAADRGYDLLRAWVSASCCILQQAGGRICYGHEVLHLLVSYSRQGLLLVTGMGFCILYYLTADKSHDLL